MAPSRGNNHRKGESIKADHSKVSAQAKGRTLHRDSRRGENL